MTCVLWKNVSLITSAHPFLVTSFACLSYTVLIHEDMANTLKEGAPNTESSPQPLSVQPPPRGHFTSTQSDAQPTTDPSAPPPTVNGTSSADQFGVVSDDPTTYWLGIDAGTNEFAQNANAVPPPSSSRSSRRSNTNHNNNNNSNNNSNNNNTNINTSPNNNQNVTTSPTTNGVNLTTDSPNGDANVEKSDESIAVNGGSTNGTRHTRKGYPFTGPSTSTTTSDFPRNNNKNRQMHTNRNSAKRVSTMY
jgi:hypothetical protein